MDITSLKKIPINLDLLTVSEQDKIKIGEVTEIQIFDNNNNFHPKGLFSTTLFGNIGTEYRNRTFAFIDLRIEILHPLIYFAVISLKSFYKQIMDGSTLAEWDSKTKSFIKSNSEEARTGYSFFMEHIEELVFERNESDKRSFLIDLFNKAIKENKHKMRYLLVLPAGLRDYSIDDSGKPQEDEINKIYRKILFQSSIIDPVISKKSPEIYDDVRNSLQKITLDLFDFIKSLLEGKHKLILGKWLTRKIFNSTRNVLSNPIEHANNINDPNRLGYNESYIGLHQFLRAIAPKTIYEIKNKYIKDIFIENNSFAYLTNAKTLKREEVMNTHIQKDYDLWTSAEGLEKVIANFANLDLRHLPITLNKGKHYLGLIYKDDKYFKFLQDIDSVPEGFDKSKVSPVTMAEFLYMSVFSLSGKYPGLITRYPITGYGSIYPCFLKLKTTNVYESLEELDFEWKPSGQIASCFPIRNKDFFNSIAAHTSHYKAMTADVDGDTLSVIGITTDEAIQEIREYLGKREYYISPDNRFYFSVSQDTIDAVLNYLTG